MPLAVHSAGANLISPGFISPSFSIPCERVRRTQYEDILRLAYKNDPTTFNEIIQKNLDDAHLNLGDKHKNHHA